MARNHPVPAPSVFNYDKCFIASFTFLAACLRTQSRSSCQEWSHNSSALAKYTIQIVNDERIRPLLDTS